MILFYILAALSGKFQQCNSEKEGRTGLSPRAAGERERNSITQQNGVSKERVGWKERDETGDAEIDADLRFLSRLILGCITRFEKRRDISKLLQEEWSRSAKLKHQREEEERRFRRCEEEGLHICTYKLVLQTHCKETTLTAFSQMSRRCGLTWSQSFIDFFRCVRSAGQPLVDKLEQYKRCFQCKKRITNCGESNIWRDSTYLCGSQFMIW